MKPIRDLSDEELMQVVRRAVALPDAPGPALQAAIDLWPARPPGSKVAQAARAAAEHIIAALSFDSWASAPIGFGVRSLPSPTRQLLFTAQGRDVDLRVSPSGDQYAITGQVLGPDQAGAVEVTAVAVPADADRVTRAASLDELGEFRVDDLPSGTYRLMLRLAGTDIELPPVEVGERDA